MKCLVIDDEKHALDVITNYIKKVPFLELSASYADALKGLEHIQNNSIDLLFIDIEMPDITGIQFLQTLVTHPLVIFTTAYSEYAVKSFEFNVVDYLLKPIEFDRFLKAVNKAYKQHQLQKQGHQEVQKPRSSNEKLEHEPLMIKSGTKIHRIKPEELLYVESYGNYVNFHTTGEKLLSVFSFPQVLEILPENLFARIHKSYIVNLKQIDMVERHQVTIKGKKIPIGRIYKEGFTQKLKYKGLM